MRSLLLLAAFVSLSAHAGNTNRLETMIALPNGNQLYVDYQRPAAGKETVILLNGLTYSTSTWRNFADALSKASPGTGILRYDMRGMGKTLLAAPLPVTYNIPLDNQVDELHYLINYFKLGKAALVGLSYGGGVATAFAARYPHEVSQLILMAPYTEAVASQDRWILSEVKAIRMSNPFNPATDDELYDFFLRQLIFSTYPAAEPVVLENPFKLEAVFRMVQGIRKFKAVDVADQLPANSVHLMLANQDQYLDRDALEAFWKSIPNSARASRINISYTEHKMPEAIPGYSAAWVAEIVGGNPEISGGRVFTGSTWNDLAKSGDVEITLRKH